MSEVTLELVQARQAELAQLIEQLKRGTVVKGPQISLPAIDIELEPGEHYAGTVLDEQGHVKHHLLLMAAWCIAKMDELDALNVTLSTS